jgi:hypothetical protein
MVSGLGASLATFSTPLAIPVWRDALLIVFFVVAGFAILSGLLLQIWIPAVQLRRFSRIFAGRPEAIEAFNRVVQVYGWRARLACKLFSIPIPPGVQARGSDKPVV